MRRPALVGLLLALATGLGHAQVRGLPIVASGAAPGVSAVLEVAFPGDVLGGGTVWGTSVGFQRGRFGAVATGALVDHDSAPAEAAFGLRAELLLRRSAMSPFQVLAFAGAGTIEPGGTGREWRIPAGMSFAFRVPTPVVTFVPWLSARMQWTALDDVTDASAGIGAGLDLMWRERYGLRAAYDRLLFDGTDETTFGLGLTYTFTSGL
jgi:hypothetical protein